MHTALGFGGRDTLYTMHTGFKFQFAEDGIAFHGKNQFLVTAKVGFASAHGLDRPTTTAAESLIHAGKISGPERGFIAAGTGSDFQHHTALIARILGQ